MKSLRTPALRATALAAAAFVTFPILARAQDTPATAASTASPDAVRNLQDQVRELRSMVDEMRTWS